MMQSLPFFHLRSAVPFSRPVLGRHQVLFFDPDIGTGTGTGSQQDSTLQALLQRHNNDAMALVASLYAENGTLRGQVPAQGSVVLSGGDVQTWQGFQQLNTSLIDLQERLTTATSEAAELAGLKREKLFADVAGIGDGTNIYKPSVLARLAGDKLQFEVRGEGDKRSVVVKDGDKETPLGDYAKSNWGEFLGALHVVGTQQAGTQHVGTQFVRQPSGSGAPQDIVSQIAQDFQSARDNKPNPLVPQAAQK